MFTKKQSACVHESARAWVLAWLNSNYWWSHSRPIQFNFSISSWPDVKLRYGMSVCVCMYLIFFLSIFPPFALFLPYFLLPSVLPFPLFNCLRLQVCACARVILRHSPSLSIFLLPARWWQLQHQTAFLHIPHVFLIKRLMLLFTIRLCCTPALSHTHDEAQPLGKV